MRKPLRNLARVIGFAMIVAPLWHIAYTLDGTEPHWSVWFGLGVVTALVVRGATDD